MDLKSFEDQTGWQSPMPGKSICQDPKYLLRVKNFSYDLEDYEFIKYFTNRTGICLDIYVNPITKKIEPAGDMPFDEWKSGPGNRNSKLLDPEGKDRFLLIIRGRLQQAWELYKNEN